MRPLVVLLVLTAQFISCFSQKTIISIGSNVPFSVAKRSEYLIKKASQYPVEVHPSDGSLPTLPANSIFISLGNTATTRELISQSELNNLGGEAYIIRSQTNGSSLIIATDGNPHHEKRYQFNSSIGAAYGTYQTLELLGFAFLHPLDPFVPSSLLVPQQPINLIETPKWFHRAWHLHTQHPLELTDFLQGMDIETDYGYSEGWESMIHDWEKTLEWLLANLQNEVEWVLLLSRGWGEWGVGDIRKERLRMINNICHDFGMPCGVDVPIALSQQHSWRMIGTRHNPNAPIENDFEKIRENLDWWADANFDFVTTENGFSEFSSGSCTKMLEWMNYATKYAEEQHSMKMVIKVHISTGQTCEEYPDPVTGEPINFNFLPIYADTRLGIMPHTVQFYALDDPAPTYGNDNFTFMYDFMFQQAGSGRSVIYYPETAYWVNYDNQVPLFLPIYALNRIRDIRMISKRQEQEKRAINGHCIFDSGWEWGYWLQDVVVARGSWNPQDQHSTDEKALVEAMKPFTKLFGKYESEISNLIVQLAVAQKDLLIYGKVNGVPPNDIEKRNGIAYLEGWDTWAEIGTTFESFLNTQPRHLGLNQFRFRLNTKPDYNSEVKPLLAEMDATFADLASKISVYETLVPIESQALLSEIIDGFKIVSNRATQVYALYDYASTWKRGQTPERKRRLETAQKAMTEAEVVIRRREKQYRTPLERIAGWRKNPTVYIHTYLWNVKSLYYFWRDYDKAVHQSFDVMSPCYMNFINPIDVAIGEGYLLNATIALRKWADENRPGNHFIIDCAAAPLSEPSYPLPQSSVEYEFVEELKDDLNALKSSEDF